MDLARNPDSRLAATVLPAALYRALRHVFEQSIAGCMLVGGTALAGYYAGHRRSDDLDLFTEDGVAHGAAVLAVKSLTEIGASLRDQRTSARFQHATARLDGHDFTVQVVLDPHLFVVGRHAAAADGVVVASLDTLLKMKAATLVSRASEKDLYDLAWLFEHARALDVPTLLELGHEIDAGMNAEGALISLVGSEPRESACGFSRNDSPAEVLATVERVRRALIEGCELSLRGKASAPIVTLIRRLR